MSKIRIAQFGLGPIGIETLKLAASKPWAEIVGGIDIDPEKIGKPLAEITGDASIRHAKVYRSLDDLVAKVQPDVIFHTAVSKVSAAFPQIEPIVRRGISVVSSCEELLFPQLREPELAVRLDKACKDGNARVLGTGVNPGFVMDVLPVCLTGVCREVKAVHVQRVVNAVTRRGPLQKKIGSGLAPAEFERLFDQYAPAPFRDKRTQIDRALRILSNPDEDPASLDEFASLDVTAPEQIRDLFVRPFHFGCEADDPTNQYAFNTRINPFEAQLKALFSSDIGHWDVPDMRGVLDEAYELVEHELITADNFRDFVFGNAVSLYTATKADFFNGTVIAQAAMDHQRRTRLT